MESFSCSWRILLAFIQFNSIWYLIVIRNKMISILKILKLIWVFNVTIVNSTFQFRNWPSIQLAFSWYFQFLLTWLFHTNYISSFEWSIYFYFTGLFNRSLRNIRRGIKLTTVRALINFELYNFFVGIHKVLILVLILQTISQGVLLYIFPIFKLTFYLSQ